MRHPSYVLKAADLLVNGAVGGFNLQPYESHIPFLLSFLADYNLYGCDWIEFEKYSKRPSNFKPRTASTKCEVDIEARDILNVHQLRESSDIKIHSLQLLVDQDNKRRLEIGSSIFDRRTVMLSQRPNSQVEWERSVEYEAKLQSLIGEARKAVGTPANKKSRLDQGLKPTFYSVPGHSQALETSQAGSDATQNDEDLYIPSSQPESQLLPAPSRSSSSAFLNEDLVFDAGTQPIIDPETATQLSLEYASAHPLTMDGIIESLAEPAESLGVHRALNLRLPEFDTVANCVGVQNPPVAHYSNPKDASIHPFLYGGKKHHIKTLNSHDLPPFDYPKPTSFMPMSYFVDSIDSISFDRQQFKLQLAKSLPHFDQVTEWYQATQLPSPEVTGGFLLPTLNTAQPLPDSMSVFVAEVFAHGSLGEVVSSSRDPVDVVFWYFKSPECESYGCLSSKEIIGSSVTDNVKICSSELDILNFLNDLIVEKDPDVLCGYEILTGSWGYLNARYQLLTGSEYSLGRVEADPEEWRPARSEFVAKGRNVLNLWNILRHEASLLNYTLEHVVYHTLHKHTPHYPHQTLRRWWLSGNFKENYNVLSYFQNRTRLVSEVLDHYEIVDKYAEQARIFGTDFYSCLTRGSQFKVESVLCRLSKRDNFILISPSRKQVGGQNALEYIPLVMEPKSDFYTDPVCVLDFRSLYPSIVIAFNLCYSTCIGRLDLFKESNKLGIVDDLKISPETLVQVKDDIYVAPNGIGYVKSSVRKSLLSQMLNEILSCRFMVKDSMKFNSDDARYQRKLNGQQLALKFIANVTYGYTSASFSGRMPCSELADSIVSTGREVITQAVRMIESCQKWGISASVVYGDTDSLFVRLPRASRAQAFLIGAEIADMVSQSLPSPIQLQLEKVYHPCILLTKKRYVGAMYERPEVHEFKFDAKGIETIRRDGTPIVQKLERQALEILFTTCDLSLVKSYLQKQWTRIIAGQNNIRDFCFAQEVKLGRYKATTKANLPGGAIVSLANIAEGRSGEPQYRERIPFVVTAGAPGSRIADRVVSPEAVINNNNLTIDAEYYITKNIIPALDRLFNVVGTTVMRWYQDMPRVKQPSSFAPDSDSTMRSYIRRMACEVCDRRSELPVCQECETTKTRSLYHLQQRLTRQERVLAGIVLETHLCGGLPEEECDSLECPHFYKRQRAFLEYLALKTDIDSAIAQLTVE